MSPPSRRSTSLQPCHQRYPNSKSVASCPVLIHLSPTPKYALERSRGRCFRSYGVRCKEQVDRSTLRRSPWESLKACPPKKSPSQVTPENSSDGSPSRVYTHKPCGGSTVVSGREFLVLSDPFAFVEKSYCAECQTYAALDDVVWSDSQELIQFCRKQTRRSLSPLAYAWGYAVGPLVGAIGGGVAGACWPPHTIPEIVTGVIGGAIIGWLVLQVPARQFLGMDFRFNSDQPKRNPHREH